MTTLLHSQDLAARAEIVSSPAPRACEDRTFELPPILHVASASLLFGFVAVLSFAFRNPDMVIPFAICAIFIGMFFAVPSLWPRMAPGLNRSSALRWSEFAERGIATATGRCGARDATVLVLLLPLLIFCWALAVAAIAALV